MQLPVTPPVEPMLARLRRDMPAGDLRYEPKWDGFRCLIFRDGDQLLLQSRNGRGLDRYFPELDAPLRDRLPDRVVVDGELVVPVGDRLDFDALSNRIHPAESRVRMLAEQSPARVVLFDVLALGDERLMEAPLTERHARLSELMDGRGAPLHVSPATDDVATARDWFERFEGAGLDGVIAKARDGVYEPGKRSLLKVKHQRTAEAVVGGFRWHKDGEGIGSLLLGLYDDHDRLRHIGVASSFSADLRRRLAEELAPVAERVDPAAHPWLDTGTGADASPRQPHRWSGGKDTSWQPLPIGLVAEVTYEQLQGDRLRHGARFLRWRPDRDASSCRYDQLEEPAPAELRDVLGLGRAS